MQGYVGTLWANSQGAGCGECARVHRYSMSKQSGRVHYAGTPVDYEQTVREEDAASVQGYTGTLWANSQGEGAVRVHRYTMSKQSGRRMRRVCKGTPVQYEQTFRTRALCGYTGRL